MKSGRVRTLKSAKYLEKKKKKFLINISIYSGAMVVFIALFFLFLHVSFLQVSNIKVNGSVSINTSEIEQSIKNILSGNYFYLIPRSNFAFYPKNEIKDNILSTYSKISNVELKLSGLTGLDVNISEREPNVMVCDGFRQDEGDDNCYFSDASGFVFENTKDALVDVSEIYFKYYISSNTNPVTVGKSFVSAARFNELQDFVKNVNTFGIKTNGLLINEDNSFELYINNVDGSESVVYFDDRIPFSKTLSSLNVFWQNMLDKKLGIKFIPSFEYINLRFGNNVFYLIKNGSSTKQ